jgi:ribosomal protein S18 acetylase RimI-like enzyme
MSVVLRQAALAEQDLLRRLLAAYLFEFDGQTEPYRYLAAYWVEPERLPFLIESEGEIAGLALVRVRGREWTIAEFSVIPEMRRKGVGSKAVAAVVQRADAAGARYVEATVQIDKLEALAFWRACGFRVVREDDPTVMRREI